VVALDVKLVSIDVIRMNKNKNKAIIKYVDAITVTPEKSIPVVVS
jgi:hypothetical protein